MIKIYSDMVNSDIIYFQLRLKSHYDDLTEKLNDNSVDESWTKSIQIDLNCIIEELKEKFPNIERIQKILPSDVDTAHLSMKTGQVSWIRTKIQKIMDILTVEFEINANPKDVLPLLQIENIFLKFHEVVKQLQKSVHDSTVLEIKNEYGVQNLVHALLKLHFNDIRPEEWTPSYAGSSARIDFVLPDEKTVIEIKKTREGLTSKKIGEELIIDIAKYQTHPDCQLLYCFIYDPDELITNPAGLIKDLESNSVKISVKVFIAPNRF